MKLNLGCGHSRVEGFINVDIDPNVKPDILCDITKRLPYDNDSIEEVWLIHVIEHLPKKLHFEIFKEISRVLKIDGKLVLAYPEFATCAKNYLINKNGKRDFWEATIYGRQNTPHDFHVSIIDTPFLAPQLTDMGFKVEAVPQEGAEYYTVMQCVKMRNIITRDDLLRQEVFNWR